jgi:mannose-6-phosphate isomerase-like protein (cupin superfamily)
MHLTRVCISAACLLGLAMAQQPAPQGNGAGRATAPRPPKLYISAGDIQTAMETAVKNRTPAQVIVTQSIISLAPYNAQLEYRPAPGVNPAAIHPTDAEFFCVVSGTATLVTGGTIVDGKIEGGTPQKLAKGDFAIVPENTNHWFTNVSENFFDVSLHVPRPVPPAAAPPAARGN